MAVEGRNQAMAMGGVDLSGYVRSITSNVEAIRAAMPISAMRRWSVRLRPLFGYMSPDAHEATLRAGMDPEYRATCERRWDRKAKRAIERYARRKPVDWFGRPI